MKPQHLSFLNWGIALWLALILNSLALASNDTLEWQFLLEEANSEIKLALSGYQNSILGINNKLQALSQNVDKDFKEIPTLRLRYLQRRRLLEQQQRLTQETTEVELLRIRFKKGIELIKILYEKLLALDHHFTGMQTYQNILMLSNPNSYPDFKQTQAIIQEKMKRKYAVNLPSLLSSNPYISATFSLVGALLGNNKSNERQEDIEKIACILDFTVRMNSDLSVIHHETEYLKEANRKLKAECETLFADYVKVIGYLVDLETCRQSDDWETAVQYLNDYVQKIEQQTAQSDPNNLTYSKPLVDLEFATKRVADFITKYHSFIDQGMQYYYKFDKIISSYEHEELCQEQLPRQFNELQFDIKSTIEKFTNTYYLPDMQGSKLKKLMYGELP